jgi:hypothetical protein
MGLTEVKSAPFEKAALRQGGERGFELVLKETIVSSTTDLLGDLPAGVLLARLDIDGLVLDPALFHSGLLSLLGSYALILEQQIVKDLYRRLGMFRPPTAGLDFLECAATARSFYLSRNLKVDRI